MTRIPPHGKSVFLVIRDLLLLHDGMGDAEREKNQSIDRRNALKGSVVGMGMKMSMIVLALAILGMMTPSVEAYEEMKNPEPGKNGWKTIAEIPLPGNPTRFDYQSFDPVSGRLYVAHLGDSHLVVFDTKTNRVVANLPGYSQVHGVLDVRKLGRVYATVTSLTSTKNGHLIAVDAKTLKKVGQVEVGLHPDGLDFEEKTGRVFVSNEWGKSLSVIDAVKNKKIASIPLHGEVGNTRVDPVSHYVYSTVQTKNVLDRIDPFSLRVDREYPLPCHHPHGLWINSRIHVAYVACEWDSQILVVDLGSGKTLAAYPSGVRPDVLSFDPVRGLLFVAAESGEVSVYRRSGKGLVSESTTFLGRNAHTIFVDSRTHRIYLPLQTMDGQPGLKILLYKGR